MHGDARASHQASWTFAIGQKDGARERQTIPFAKHSGARVYWSGVRAKRACGPALSVE